MINLLLPEDKKIISKEYHSRVIVSYCIAFGLLMLISVIVVVSIYGVLIINQNSLGTALKIENQGSAVREYSDYSSQISKSNKMIDYLINDTGNLHTASDLLDRIVSVKPAGIKLRNIDAGKRSSGEWSVNLQGSFGYRNDLIEYIDILKKDSLFKIIDSPFSNLIKGTNSDFSIVITLAELQKNVQK